MNARHLLRRDPFSRLVAAAVQPTVHLQSFGSGGASNQANDRFVITQRLERGQPIERYVSN